jgi:hypothetical protein
VVETFGLRIVLKQFHATTRKQLTIDGRQFAALCRPFTQVLELDSQDGALKSIQKPSIWATSGTEPSRLLWRSEYIASKGALPGAATSWKQLRSSTKELQTDWLETVNESLQFNELLTGIDPAICLLLRLPSSAALA